MDKETEHSKETLPPPIEEVVVKCEIIEESDEELRLYQPTEYQKEQIVPVAVATEVSLPKPKEKRTKLHGDMHGSTPNGFRDRIPNMKKWTTLTDALNADVTGSEKSQVKWKKVWSDYKNNTRRKAARCSQVGSDGSGSGLKLTHLEQRVMNLLESKRSERVVQVPEIDLDNVTWKVMDASPNVEDGKDSAGDLSSDSYESNNSKPNLTTSESEIKASITAKSDADPLGDIPATSRPKWRRLTAIRRAPPHSARILRPTQPLFLGQIPRLDPEDRIYQKEKDLREYNLEKERLRLREIELQQASPAKTPLTQPEYSKTHFPMSDSEWRSYQKEKDLRDYELEKERLRLREIELQQHSHWQELFAQFLSIVNKVADKYTENKDREH